MAKGKWAGPDWFTCLGQQLEQYRDDVESMNDEFLLSESYRVEVQQPPEQFNDRDWRLYRRLVRQEMHRRELITPAEKP